MSRVNPVLTVLRQQAEGMVWQLAADALIDAAENFFEREERIRAQRYNRERENEELAAARSVFVDAGRASNKEARRLVSDATQVDLRKWTAARAERTANRGNLADAINMTLLQTSDDPSELIALVREAQAAGDAVGEEARRIAERRVRAMAADEMRQHKQNGVAFRALCTLNERARAVDRDGIIARGDRECRAAHQMILEVAKVVGLAGEVQRAITTAAAPAKPSAPSKIVFGSYWERLAAEKTR